jgi:two-component system, OmpR family, response regulator ChvI
MKGKKVILVEDEPDIVITFKAALESEGFEVEVYHDPIIALSEFKPGYYDLAILDIKMPEMNGFELYSEMQKIDKQVSVCFITAGEMYYEEFRSTQRQNQEEYCELDPDRFLRKPISNIDLIKRIEKIISTKKD